MISLWRGNSYTEVMASAAFLEYLRISLSIPIVNTKDLAGPRFGSSFEHEGTLYGSLLKGNRIPSGLTRHAYMTAQKYGEPVEVRDTRVPPEEQFPWWALRANFRPYQDVAHEQFVGRGYGVIVASPRAGKTLMAMRVIDTLAQPTLYLAPSNAIVSQTYQVMVRTFGVDMVARLGVDAADHEKDIDKPIVISTPNSAVKLPEEWYRTRGLLICDEFHHAAATTYHKINDKADSIYYRLGLTGTHFRTGDDELAMEAICSSVVYQIPYDYLVRAGFLAPARVVFVPHYRKGVAISPDQYAKLYRTAVAEDESRNEKVAHIAKTLSIDNGIQTIVLTKRRNHADLLGQMIPGSVVAKGGEGLLTSRTVQEFRDGRHSVLVGTTVLGEGVDLPNAGALVYASGGGGSVAMMQSYFRPLTGLHGKSVGLIYDFMDMHHKTLKNQSEARLSLAESYLGPVVRL